LTAQRDAGVTPDPYQPSIEPAARIVGFSPMITVAALTGSIRQLIHSASNAYRRHSWVEEL
jgi:hypothetical protein